MHSSESGGYAPQPSSSDDDKKHPRYMVTCTDGKTFAPTDAKLVGSVEKVRSRDVHQPPVVGEYPVLVEQSGDYRMFTYSAKIQAIN